MDHQVIVEESDFEALQEEWRTLLARSSRDFLPSTWGWTRAWWNSFAAGRKLRIHAFREDGQLRALFPLLLNREPYHGISLWTQVAMSNGHSPYWEPVLDPAIDSSSLASMLLAIRSSTRLPVTRFSKVPMDSPFSVLVDRAPPEAKRHVRSSDGYCTPLVHIDGSWEQYLAQRSPKFRKSLRNKLNRFSKSGGRIERRRIDSRNCSDTLDVLVEVSRNSWKGKAGSDLGAQSGARTFLEQLVSHFGDGGGTDVWLAWEGDRPIAYEFHTRHAGVTYPLRADFDEGFRDSAPGSIVEYSALKAAFDDPSLRLYDSCAADYWYLSNWSNRYRAHRDINLFGSGLAAQALRSVEYTLLPCARALRRAIGGDSTPPTPTTSEPSSG